MRVVFTLLILLLTACVPYPHYWNYAPPIAGVVTEDGSPVVGATIELSARFTELSATTQTDTDGKFRIGPLREFEMTTSLLGDRFVFYTVKIKTKDRDYVGYDGMPNIGVDSNVSFSCNLSSPIHLAQEDQYCREDSRKK